MSTATIESALDYTPLIHAAQQAGLTSTNQLRALIILGNGPRILSDLARALRVSSAAVTTLADTLEKRGLAGRRRPAGDRRAITLHLTAAGAGVLLAATA